MVSAFVSATLVVNVWNAEVMLSVVAADKRAPMSGDGNGAAAGTDRGVGVGSCFVRAATASVGCSGIGSGAGATGGTGSATAGRDRPNGGDAGRGIAGGEAPHDRPTVAGGVRMLAEDSEFAGTGTGRAAGTTGSGGKRVCAASSSEMILRIDASTSSIEGSARRSTEGVADACEGVAVMPCRSEDRGVRIAVNLLVGNLRNREIFSNPGKSETL